MLQLFSADDHIVEHGRVWSDRLPSKYQEAGPRVIEDDGIERWVYENEPGPPVTMAAMGPSVRDRKSPHEVRTEVPQRFSEMLPGCYDPVERGKDLLDVGVVASLGFPSVPRFGGTLFVSFDDKELASLCVKAYNDFVLDEWCPSGPPGMYVPMAICQLWDPEAAAEEIRRCADRGVRAVSMPENLVFFGLPSYYTDFYDPIWRACEEADIAVCMHLATAGNLDQYKSSPEAPMAVQITAAGVSMSAVALTNLIFSPVCTKFPKLKIVFSESGIGWLPFALGRADLVWERHHSDDVPKDRPSEIFRRNMFVCQVEEYVGLNFLEYIGADKVLWELDYPHPDTVWPLVQEHAGTVFSEAGLDQEQIEMIAHKNSEKLFRWTPAELPTAAAAAS